MRLTLVFLFVWILFPLTIVASNDTIILVDIIEDYNLNLATKDSLTIESRVEKTIFIKNNSTKKEWFFKCDSWGEVILNIRGEIFEGGWNYPYEQSSFSFTRENRCPTIPIVLENDSVYEIKVVLSSPVLRGFPSYYECEIVHSETIGELNSFRTIVTGGLVVILLVLAIYNFFLFFITKDKIFIIYSISQLLFSLLWLNAIGISLYVFEFNLNYLRVLDSVLSMSYMASYFWFTRSYLSTKELDTKIDIWLKYYQYILFFTVVLLFLFINVNINIDDLDFFFTSLLVLIYTPVGVILLIISIIRAILRRNRLVIYFAFAMLAFVVTILIMNLELMGASSNNIFVQNSVLFGTVVEAILFSLGLAAKIKIAQEDKQVAQDKLLIQLKENEKIKDEFSKGLEKNIEERTLELVKKNEAIEFALKEKEGLIKEVHHRVKNNLQLMYSFMSLQSNRTNNELVISSLSESKERVRTLAMIHDKLSLSENSEEIDIKDYIPDIVNHLSNLSVTDKLIPVIQIDSIMLPVNKAVSLGLIINEIVTNSLKYAKALGNEKKVYISASRNNNNIELIVFDNGISSEETNTLDQSLGTLIIKDLAKQLKATLEIGKDFRYKIVVPLN